MSLVMRYRVRNVGLDYESSSERVTGRLTEWLEEEIQLERIYSIYLFFSLFFEARAIYLNLA